MQASRMAFMAGSRFTLILLEPISYIGTCATEAMWDAVLGGSPAAICRYCKGYRQQDAPPRGRFATASSPCPNGRATVEGRCTAPRPFGLLPGGLYEIGSSLSLHHETPARGNVADPRGSLTRASGAG